MSPIVHYLGPEGTFAHAAALSAYGGTAQLIPGQSVLDVFETVASDPNVLGVVPIENSIEGSVSLTLEALAEGGLQVTGEIVVRVEQCLLSNSELAEVRCVHSHPHGLAQCKRWLRQHLPQAELVSTASTAAAAIAVRDKPGHAAVASELAGKLAGVNVLVRGIQDGVQNATRFIVLGHSQPPRTGFDKTSLVFDVPHERGALCKVLGIFDRHGLNLSRIESRPLRGEPWHYVFYADVEGHATDPAMVAALAELGRSPRWLKVLGSYRRAELPPAGPPESARA